MAFLYSDLETALVGSFTEGVMIAAQPAVLQGMCLQGGVAVPTFSEPQGPPVGLGLSTEESVGPGPLVGDPYEARAVEVRTSSVEGGGEGLYARRDIKAGEVVAFYNGIRLPYEPGLKEDWATSGYKIFINADHSSGERMDLPGKLTELSHYCATLGHKMNHSFDYNCSEWFFEHPRHGTVPCAMARQGVKKGEELLLHYGYDPENCPAWYKAALQTFLEDHSESDLWTVSQASYKDKPRGKDWKNDPVGG